MRKLALVGSHPSTCKLAPFEDETFEIWVLNEAPLAQWCKRWDVCVQIHKREVYSAEKNWVNPKYWAWLQEEHGKTIYLQDRDERVPDSKRYPLDEILATIPGGQFHDIESGPAYALVLALYLGYEEIHIWGVELTSNTEYSYQLPDWKFWVGVALGMGVRLVLHSGEVHFQARLYGYEGEIQIEHEYYQGRMAKLNAAWHKADAELKRAKERTSMAILERKYDKMPDLIKAYQNAGVECGILAGALAEAEKYAGKEQLITRQEFEKRAAWAQQEGESQRVLMYNASGKVEYVFNVWKQHPENYEAVTQLRNFIQEQIKYAYDTGAHMGIFRENNQYLDEYDKRLTAAGGVRTLKALTGQETA
jgi:hypothetical protein